MIKKFIDKLLDKTSATLTRKKPKFGKRVDIPQATHLILAFDPAKPFSVGSANPGRTSAIPKCCSI